MAEYNENFKRRSRLMSTKNLIAEAQQAAAWGVPSQESVGYSQSGLCSIIYKLIDKVKELDSIVQLNKVP